MAFAEGCNIIWRQDARTLAQQRTYPVFSSFTVTDEFGSLPVAASFGSGMIVHRSDLTSESREENSCTRCGTIRIVALLPR